MLSLIRESIKCASKKKCSERAYHVHDNADVYHSSVKMSCNSTPIPTFSFCGTHTKTN